MKRKLINSDTLNKNDNTSQYWLNSAKMQF